MNLIVAVDKNWGIGKDNNLLVHLKGDMKYFREQTLGKVVVMGRSTLESFPEGKPLKDRTNIVITHRNDFKKDGVIVVHNMDELAEEINKYNPEDVMVIGGASVYNELMTSCDRLLITKIDKEFDADTFIKNVDELHQFKVLKKSEVQEENGIKFQFVEYIRKRV